MPFYDELVLPLHFGQAVAAGVKKWLAGQEDASDCGDGDERQNNDVFYDLENAECGGA